MTRSVRPLLASLAFAVLAGSMPIAHAQQGVRPEVGKPLQAAQALIKQRKGREALAEVAKAEPARKAHKPNPHRQEDARHCLDKPTNTEIIKCAEAYL